MVVSDIIDILSLIASFGVIAMTYNVYKLSHKHTQIGSYLKQIISNFFEIEDYAKLLKNIHNKPSNKSALEQCYRRIETNATLMRYYVRKFPENYDKKKKFEHVIDSLAHSPEIFEDYDKLRDEFKSFCKNIEEKKRLKPLKKKLGMLLKKFFKRILGMISLGVFSINSFAYDFGVDGIFYNIISDDQVEVTKGDYDPNGCYFGTIQIPETVNYNDAVYCVTSIGEYAFRNCGRLESIKLPNSLTIIKEGAFHGCTKLKSIIIPNSVTSIGDYAFYGCSYIESVTLPDNLEIISKYMLAYCKFYLFSIDIPKSVRTIEEHAFDSSALTSIIIPEGLITIGEGAFERCNKLSSVSISSTVTSIGDWAFASGNGVRSLETVTSNITSPFPIPGNVFREIKWTAVLRVPKGTKSEYEKYSAWTKNFSSIEEFGVINSYNLSITSIGAGSASYNDLSIRNETKIITVDEGTSATITFLPDNGYQIKSLKVNGTSVTANTSYTATINADTSVEVEFEAIPPTTYNVSIKAIGNGFASYDGESIRETTKSYTVNEGTSVSISFTPDAGYRIKSLKVNNAAVTASSSYSATINANTTIEVEFESIPPTTYTLSIKATGNGSASYAGEAIRNTTKSYTINEGTSVSVSFSPDAGYRIKSLKVNGASVTASISYTVTVNADTSVEVEFEAIPPTTYTLSIKATGNGSASYDGTTIKGKTSTFTVNEGTSATISFMPDTGYRIKSVKENSKDVTSSVSDNKYTSTINADTSIEVEFETIPVTTYTLTIKATGNGSASYDGTTIKSKTSTFTVNEGTSATISFMPDTGYRIKSVKENSKDVTSSVSDNKYTTTINADTSIEVEFEAIPVTTYTLTIKATGNGSATYSGTSIKNTTKSFTVNEGTSCTIAFSPDNGYRIKTLKINNSAVTASASYTVIVNANTSVEVEFEAIPATTYTLSIKATGNGSATYNGTAIKNATKSFTVNEGTSCTITFSPDNGYRIKTLKVNNSAVTASSSYTVTVKANTSVEVEFEAIPATTYTLSIKATGNGSATYSGTAIKNTTKSFTVNEGTSCTITFSPDNGYRIKTLKVNGSAVTASTSYTVIVNANTSVEVEFEAIPATTYTLSIKATGNGSATYSGTSIKNTTKSFTVNEGTSCTITFSPDNGYRIKSLKVNNSAVTASSSYTVTVNANTSVEVEFEEIPVTTYSLSIKATGNGYAAYSGKTIREKTSSFTVNEGTSVTVTFTPDDGYHIKSLKVNGSSVTTNTSYTTTINSDTSIEVVFEAKPDDPDTPKTYSLSIRAKGNGVASYEGDNIREKTSTYTVDEGTKATISFTPDEGYQIASLKVNGTTVTTTSTCEVTVNSDTSVKVEFEKIPDNPDEPTTYSLSVKASGNGIASYEGEIIRDNTSTFIVNEGTSATISFTPDNGYEINSVIVNDSDVTSEASRHQYTLTIIADTSIEVDFKESESQSSITLDGITYQIVSDEEQTLMLSSGDFGLILEVPEKIEFLDREWTIVGIAYNALENSEDLATVIWNPEMAFNAKVKNPNLLLYVKDESYAPADIENVVVNGYAKSITLTDAQSGNNFYCPIAFTAQTIEYTHSYYMKTGLNESRGWETISLPFEVQQFSHGSKGEIVPFVKWMSGSSEKPFWLYEMSGSGFVEAETIKANTPYIISMPNNDAYPNEYHLTGRITFSSVNVMVENTADIQTTTYSNNTFIPNFTSKDANSGYYALNVSNDFEYYRGSENEGCKFILNLRKIHPFEAYMTSTSNTRSIDIFDAMTTGIRGIEEIVASEKTIKVYDLSGRLIKTGTAIENIRRELPIGVYIVNNKKMIIK